MFKSIRNRLALLTALLVTATAGATWLFTGGHLFWGFGVAAAVVASLRLLARGHKKIDRNMIFLLNALENGDYSFNFSEAGMSKDRREVNTVLNAIKEILVKAREAEIENEKFLSLIVAGIPVGIAIVDDRDFVRVANDAALRLLGLHVFTHLKQLKMVDETVFQTFRDLAPGRTATVCLADEREEKLISLSMSAIRIKKGRLRVVTMHNIAGEIEAREMESWIKLIRVITHEIMNSIAPITSLSETMLLSWKESGGVDGVDVVEKLEKNTMEAFETITSTARGLSSFVESYRRFTGIPKPQLREVRLAPLVEKIVALEAPVFRERGIEVKVRATDPGITVNADEGQIVQVLVNLLKNAAEAIPAERTDGAIEVRLKADCETVRLDVANNGTPVPRDVLPHIFVPFFTTKQSGTGIGLSVSRYIMRLHGGNLKHLVENGMTVFSMVFPIS